MLIKNGNVSLIYIRFDFINPKEYQNESIDPNIIPFIHKYYN